MESLEIRAIFRVEGVPFDNSVLFAEDQKGRLWLMDRLSSREIRLGFPAKGFRGAVRLNVLPDAPEISCTFDDLFLRILDTRGAAIRVGASERFIRSAAARGRIPGAFRVAESGRNWLFREAGLAWYAATRHRGRPRRLTRIERRKQ